MNFLEWGEFVYTLTMKNQLVRKIIKQVYNPPRVADLSLDKDEVEQHI